MGRTSSSGEPNSAFFAIPDTHLSPSLRVGAAHFILPHLSFNYLACSPSFHSCCASSSCPPYFSALMSTPNLVPLNTRFRTTLLRGSAPDREVASSVMLPNNSPHYCLPASTPKSQPNPTRHLVRTTLCSAPAMPLKSLSRCCPRTSCPWSSYPQPSPLSSTLSPRYQCQEDTCTRGLTDQKPQFTMGAPKL